MSDDDVKKAMYFVIGGAIVGGMVGWRMAPAQYGTMGKLGLATLGSIGGRYVGALMGVEVVARDVQTTIGSGDAAAFAQQQSQNGPLSSGKFAPVVRGQTLTPLPRYPFARQFAAHTANEILMR